MLVVELSNDLKILTITWDDGISVSMPRKCFGRIVDNTEHIAHEIIKIMAPVLIARMGGSNHAS